MSPKIYLLFIHIYALLPTNTEAKIVFPANKYWAVYNISRHSLTATPDPKKPFSLYSYGKKIHDKYTKEGFVEIESDDTVVDIGAFIGGFSVIADELGGKVIAVEPSDDNVDCLKWNTATSDSIVVSQTLLWKKNTELKLRMGSDPTDNSVFEPDDGSSIESETFKARTLDSVLSEYGIERVDFLKLDAEGAEPEVLRGIEETEVEKFAVDCSPERFGESTVQEVRSILDDKYKIIINPSGELFAKLSCD